MVTLHGFVLHGSDVLKTRRRNIPVFLHLLLLLTMRGAAASNKKKIYYISFINISLYKIPIFFKLFFQYCQHVGKNNSTAIKSHYSHSAWCLWVFAIEKVGRWGAVVATMHTLACVGLLYYLPALSGGKLDGELKWHWKGFTFLSHEPWHWPTVPLHN